VTLCQLPWAVQKWLNRLRCHLGYRAGWAQGGIIRWGPDSHAKGQLLEERTWPGMLDDILLWSVQKWLNRSICCLVVDSGGPKEAQVQSYSPGGANVPSQERTLAPARGYDWIIHLQWGCSLMSNYFYHLLWPPCVADADIIFLSCFFLSSSSFFSSPNLSRHRLDVYQTSTHGVALARI